MSQTNKVDWNIRGKLKIGSHIKYRNKEYVVVGYEGRVDYCCMVAEIVKVGTWLPLIRLVKEVFDSDIEDFEIIG